MAAWLFHSFPNPAVESGELGDAAPAACPPAASLQRGRCAPPGAGDRGDAAPSARAASCPLLMNGWGGWEIVTLPVVGFQESPSLLWGLQSVIRSQADCKSRWNSAACRLGCCSRAGADGGPEAGARADGLDVGQMRAPSPPRPEAVPVEPRQAQAQASLLISAPPGFLSFSGLREERGGVGRSLKNPGKKTLFFRKLQGMGYLELKLAFLRGNLGTSID